MNALPHRILVPVDFDRASHRAVRDARALASAINAEICLVHVIPLPPGRPLTARDRRWIDLAERTLAGIAARARLEKATTTCVLTGSIPASIGQYAIDNKFDLVILSGRSQPDWHGSLLGSTAAAILRHARMPVLVVPCARAARAARGVGHTTEARHPVQAGAERRTA